MPSVEGNMGLYEAKTLKIQHAETAPMVTGSMPRHQATDLTKGGSLAHIQLRDQVYTLRITRAGKLILTK